MMNNCRFLRRSDHYWDLSYILLYVNKRTFWGSSGSSVGWGQRTFVPSSESFNLAATESPNSILASLNGSDSVLEQINTTRGSRYALGIDNQTASTIFVIWQQVDVRVFANDHTRWRVPLFIDGLFERVGHSISDALGVELTSGIHRTQYIERNELTVSRFRVLSANHIRTDCHRKENGVSSRIRIYDLVTFGCECSSQIWLARNHFSCNRQW